MRLINLQLAIFVGNGFLTGEIQRSKLIVSIPPLLTKTFNADPQIVPIPHEAPEEIPRIILNSSDGQNAINVARSRIDILKTIQGSAENIEDSLTSISEIAASVVEWVTPTIDSGSGGTINRLGLIATLTHLTADGRSAITFMQEEFFNPARFSNAKELNLKYNRTDETIIQGDTTTLNRIIQIVSRGNVPEIQIQLDINTLKETQGTASFSLVGLNEFVAYCKTNFQGLYSGFPTTLL